MRADPDKREEVKRWAGDPDLPRRVLREAARALGMKEREITMVRDTDDGRLVTTLDGVTVVIRPSGALMLYAMPDGQPFPREGALPVYVLPGEEGAPGTWTLEDLDREASRMAVPPGAPSEDGPTWAGWVDDDPVRARAARLRQLVLDSGLLDRDKIARLRFSQAQLRAITEAATVPDAAAGLDQLGTVIEDRVTLLRACEAVDRLRAGETVELGDGTVLARSTVA